MTPTELIRKEGHIIERALRENLDKSERIFRAKVQEIAWANLRHNILCNGTLPALKESIQKISTHTCQASNLKGTLESLVSRHQQELDYFHACQKLIKAFEHCVG